MLQNFHLDCPISSNFFVKFGKNFHSSYIRREIHKAWGMHSKQFYPEVRRRLYFFGGLRLNMELHSCWREAFRYAEEWNRYPGVKKDELQIENEIQQGKWKIKKGTLEIDEPTWLSIASLSFSRDAEKESPNHLFLKELFKFYIHRYYEDFKVREEVNQNLYGDRVRCDVVVKTREKQIVGEMGGVQLWKIIALLYKGNEVVVMPHWTRQKMNPFLRKKLNYDFYHFYKGDANGD